MIRETFLVLPGIKERKEKQIREQAKDWNEFLNKEIKGISKKRKLLYNKIIEISKEELLNDNANYFAEILPQKEHHRLYDQFKDQAVFLDVEADHMSGNITVIGLYDNYETKLMIKNINLEKEVLQKELKKYKMLITYNGSSFDLPIIRRYFGNIIPEILHIDLKHLCQKVGLNGGLKQIEKKLGITREYEQKSIHITNGDPALLWRMWNGSRDEFYLDLLIAYNEEDVINLKRIIEEVMKKIKTRPLGSPQQPSP
jgi:uncharacterized protein YprB with RNaseH-like and TPR domain